MNLLDCIVNFIADLVFGMITIPGTCSGYILFKDQIACFLPIWYKCKLSVNVRGG